MIRILVISRCTPPPIRAAPDFPLCRGQNRFLCSCRDMATLLNIHSAPACRGKVVAPATKGGHTGMVHEVYDALFFSPYLSFPLEGKSREAGKGVRG